MNKKINQIISILVKQPCFRNRNEDMYSSNHNFYYGLMEIKKYDDLPYIQNLIYKLKPYFNSSEELKQYYNLLMNAVYMGKINENIETISLLSNLVNDEFHSCLIARDFSYDLGANRSNIYKIEHIDSLEKQITNIGLLVAGYNTLREPVKNQVQYIKNIFKDIDILSSGIEKILDLIVEESSKLLKNKEEFRKHQHSRIEKAS